MRVEPAVKNAIKSYGLRPAWVVEQMNKVNPSLKMNQTKLSAIVCGNRKMSGDELLAFCIATKISPDYFCTVADS